jgi:glycosyltransferase involved in cell wall biosynthesis
VALHAVQIGFHVDRLQREPTRLLEDWPSLADVAEAAQRAGARVSVVQACARTETVRRNDISYHFFAADSAQSIWSDRSGFASLISRLGADVFHVHGLCFPGQVRTLAATAPGVPILLQDHASKPPRLWHPWKRRAWRRAFACASGIAFCASEQSEPFAKARLLGKRIEVYEIPESTSHFTPGEQAEARAATAIWGDPCLLWVGRLMEEKDPLTVLAGVSDAVRHLPDLHLWCCFHTSPLLERIQHRIASDPQLRDRVHLLGRVAHGRIEQLMRAADIFVAGSRAEGSGYALIEALACGLVPVVTDIPSFRSLTGRGSVGRLWPCGDSERLTQALLEVASWPRRPLRSAVRAHFDRTQSRDALGRTLVSAYRELRDHARDPLQRAGGQPAEPVRSP